MKNDSKVLNRYNSMQFHVTPNQIIQIRFSLVDVFQSWSVFPRVVCFYQLSQVWFGKKLRFQK